MLMFENTHFSSNVPQTVQNYNLIKTKELNSKIVSRETFKNFVPYNFPEVKLYWNIVSTLLHLET